MRTAREASARPMSFQKHAARLLPHLGASAPASASGLATRRMHHPHRLARRSRPSLPQGRGYARLFRRRCAVMLLAVSVHLARAAHPAGLVSSAVDLDSAARAGTV